MNGNRASFSLGSGQFVTLITLVGFVVRLLVAQLFLGGLSRAYEGDEGGYVQLAIQVVEGLGFVDRFGNPTSYRTPGLPLMLAIPISMTGPNILIIRIFMCFVESLLIPAIYLLGWSVSGSPKIGSIAGAIAVFFPTWIIPSGSVLTDIPAAILVALMVSALLEGYRQQSLVWLTGAGLLWGMATLVRPVSLVYAPAVLFWLLIAIPGVKGRLAAVAAVMIPFACLLAPWTIRNTLAYGRFVLVSTQSGTELYKSNHPDATGILAIDHHHFETSLASRYPKDQYSNEAIRNNLYQADAIRFIRDNPLRFAQLCAIRFLQLWKLYSPRVPFSNSLAVIASFGLALPFFFIQAVRCGWRGKAETLFLLIILSQSAVHVVYTSIVRYRVPVEPLIVVMAISGFIWVLERFWRGSGPTVGTAN